MDAHALPCAWVDLALVLWIVRDKGRHRSFIRFNGLATWLKLFGDVFLRVWRPMELGTGHGDGLRKRVMPAVGATKGLTDPS
ncbi:MAG: hypothetical protein C0453_06640 [Comamonadaceae bacterium]|nr:hypothetical protein [Comamonadaceae bacterium]